MQLSVIESILKNLITTRDDEQLNEAPHIGKSSLDLTIRDVLVCSDEGLKIDDVDRRAIKGVSISKDNKIRPQETVCLISEERLHVPPGFIAYVFLKNRFSQKGLLAFNTGIVDGGFNGPLSTLLTNISLETINLKDVHEGKFFRVVFHKIKMHSKEKAAVEVKTYTYNNYLRFKANELIKLPRFFQNPDEIKKQIEGELNSKALNYGIVKLGLIIGIAGFLMVLAPPLSKIASDYIVGKEPVLKLDWQTKNMRLEERISKLEELIIKGQHDRSNSSPSESEPVQEN